MSFFLTFPFPIDFPSCFLHLLGIPHRCCRWRCCDDGTANVRLDTTTGLWGKPLVCVASQAHRKPTKIIEIYKRFIMRFPISWADVRYVTYVYRFPMISMLYKDSSCFKIFMCLFRPWPKRAAVHWFGMGLTNGKSTVMCNPLQPMMK